jgi:phosphoribosyl 1,2-cyclic phosphodiesterase
MGDMKLFILGSGSRGNAMVVESGGRRVLVDAGFGPRTLSRRLAEAELPPSSIDAMIVTHEHTDHAYGAVKCAKRWRWPVYATTGTIANTPGLGRMRTVRADPRVEIEIDPLRVRMVRTPHDAQESVGLIISDVSSGTRLGIAYDLGFVPVKLVERFKDLDMLIVEANHDDDMLRCGPYPWVVQERIRGPRGHLNNEAAGALARQVAHKELRHVVLCHLSESNNSPGLAIAAAKKSLRGTSFRGAVSVAPQDTVMAVGVTARRLGQLELGL